MFEYVIDKKLVFNGTKKKFRKTLKYIILHHSGASADQTIEQIHKYHLGKGWLGIGYNVLVDKEGKIYWGRGMDYIGAHCKGYNEISIGICAIGNMQKDNMPSAQKESIIKLIKEIREYYPSITDIVGHRDMAATDCPGANYPLSEIIDASKEQNEKSQGKTNSEVLLKEGDRGNDVSSMQSKLVALGYELGYIDSIFGPKTKKALSAYQRAKNLDATGSLNTNTNKVLTKEMNEEGLPQIKKGSRGEYVKLLQRILNKRKYDLAEDSIFGVLTEKAVLAFQKKSSIGVDGIVGPKTWHALLS